MIGSSMTRQIADDSTRVTADHLTKNNGAKRAPEIASFLADLPQVQPCDESNRARLDNVHPPAWVTPEPSAFMVKSALSTLSPSLS